MIENFFYLCMSDVLKLQLMDKKNLDIAYFLSFCIEQYKSAKGLEGAEVMRTFAEYGVLDYLNNHFDVLHTQSRQWILEDIEDFIETRRGGQDESLSW